ncbi:hypothetical protein BHM03_00039408 [Ensete ventricosum]|nr:hypothetical protein BHM03_00039408 [Ensete ventricosum]
METSLLIPTPSFPPHRCLFYPSAPSSSSSSSPFRILPRLPPRRFRRHGRCRLSLLRCSVSDAPTAAPAASPAVDPSVFGGPKELSGPQALVCALPPPVRMASSAVLAVAAMAAGFGLGLRVGGSKVAGIGGAAVLGVAGGAAVYALNSKIPEVAAINLHNLVAGYDDPTELTKDEVAAIVEKYGVSKQDDAFKAELCDLYSRFVSSVLPPGSENLKGYEVEMIIRFKEALGIDDPDAASVHVEIGRHIYRQRADNLKLVGIGLSCISGVKGEPPFELSPVSSFDLVTSFCTSSKRWFTCRSYARSESVEFDDKKSGSREMCSSSRWRETFFPRTTRGASDRISCGRSCVVGSG